MATTSILLPVFAQIALTFILWLWMAYHRTSLIRSGAVKPRDVALREPNWPPHVLKIANAAHNQLETPLLFYVLAILLIVTGKVDALFVALAWAFVVFRIMHSYVHVTSNRIPVRGPMFGLSLLTLIVMWVVFAARILAGSS